jgi:acetolactate synthase-1/2/3 large subunit
VHLSVPVDIFRAPSGLAAPSYDLRTLLRPHELVDNAAIETLSAMLARCRNVVLLIGGGCGESIHAILKFAAMKGATFVTTPDGKGLVSPQHPLFRGVFGFGGHASAEAALRDDSVDLILAIGTSMGEWNTGGWCDSLLNERLVHIDESEEHLARSPMAQFHMRGSISAIFMRLVERTERAHSIEGVERRRIARLESSPRWDPESILDAPAAYQSEATPIKPQRLMRDLSRLFPPSTRYLADAGNSVAWATHYLQPQDRRVTERRNGARADGACQRHSSAGWLRLTTHFAPMGWAIGAAVGTAAANPDVPVVCITGDGSMLMSGQELSAAVAEQLNVIFVVLNDAALGMVKHGQRLGGAEQIGFALPRTDFAMLARALGAHGHTIAAPADMDALDIGAICRRPGPTLLDVYIDPEEVPPMNARMRVLGDGA